MYKKIKSLFLGAAFFSMLFAPALLSNLTHALAIQELTPEYATGSKIEFNTPEEGYSFDVTFLAQNQNLTYKTTLQNDEEQTIVITNLDLQTPTADYLQYSFSGIAVGDELAPGASKEITIQISSNNNDTHTTAENFKFSIHYHTVDPTPNDEPVNPEEPLDIPDTNAPDTGANHEGKTDAKHTNQVTFFIVVTIASIILLVILLSNKKVKNLHAIVAVISLSLSFFIIGGVVVAEKDEVYTITGKVRFINVYSISINPGAGLYNGESGIQTIACRDGERLIINDPTYATYNFTGWATDPQTTFETDNDGNRILIADQNYELSAEWDEIYYNLTIDPNGGTYNGQTGVQVLPIRVGTTANLATPEKDGMTFTSWTKTINNNSEIITDMSINIEEDVTLVANYEDIYYDIIINPNGGSYKGSTTSTTEHVKYGTELTITDPIYNTYTFAGWDITPTATINNGVITAYDNYTLTAKWEEIYYNLTINPNGGSYAGETETQVLPYRAGTTVQISTPIKEGMNFTNWTKTIGSSSETFTDTSINMSSDIALSANYEDIYFDIIINPNGGSYNGSTTSTTEHVKYGTELTIPDPVYETYRFAGWNIMPSTTMNGTTLTAYNNYTLTAEWEEIYYTLTINPNGGIYNNSAETQEILYRAGATTDNITTPTKEGMSFTNWTKTIGDSSETFTDTSMVMNSDVTLVANYEDLYFDITVNPNGGKFNNSTDIYTARLKYGSTLDLTSIERENYTLTHWTMNTNDSLPSRTSSLQVYSNLTLTANWEVVAYYTITINPNGGTYANSTEPTVTSNVQNYTTFDLAEASYEGYALQYWEVTSGTVDTAVNGELTANSFIVVSDVTLTAHWGRTVARIERTQNIYGSIMAAEGVAEEDDIITLLIDTEETVTNSKKVTLDLNNHTVTGSLTNTTSGNITIINGEINNPSGAAVTNNGILTLGVDDYKEDGTANILNDNVRLIGTTAGLLQTNDTYKFYYYDGYLEGDSGLIGGYDGSPSYRNTFDGVVVHFYPFVNHVEQNGRSYQHVELESSDRAVSKTSVHGDIYYYNLQDNINTSAETGYKVYIVRDFDASYTLTSPENTNVTIDLVGYTVNANNVITINGVLNIEDSQTTLETTEVTGDNKGVRASTSNNTVFIPHEDNTTTTIRYGGKIAVEKTIINNNELVLTNVKIVNTTSNDIIENNHTLTTYGANLNAIDSHGSVTTLKANTTYNLDNNTSFLSATGYKTAVANDLTNAEWNNDAYVSGLTNTGSLKITKGTIAGICNRGTLTVNGGLIKGGGFRCGSTSSYGATGIFNFGTTTVNGGEIYAVNAYSAYGIYSDGCSTTCTATVNGGKVYAESTNDFAIAIADRLIVYIKGGEIEAKSIFSEGRAFSMYGGSLSITGGTIRSSTYGAYLYSTGVTIGTNDSTIHTDKPEIIANKIALYGDNDKAYAYFYDGVLRGKTKAYTDNMIKALPDATIIHTESSDDYQYNCWLVDAPNYLSVDDVEYNSYNKALRAITATTGTIKVIADASDNSEHTAISSNKTITLDLNGHEITYSQAIVNNGSLIIDDTSDNKDGKLTNINPSTNTATIVNNKNLTINNGTIQSAGIAISQTGASATNQAYTNINGGLIAADSIALKTTTYSNVTMLGGKIESKQTGIAGNNFTNITINTGENTDAIVADSKTTERAGTRAVTLYGDNNKNRSTFTLISGKLSSKSYGYPRGINAEGRYLTVDILGGEVSVYDPNYRNDDESDIGIYNYQPTLNIKGGKISSSSIGLYLNSSSATFGEDDDNISTTSPEITGNNYAVYGGTAKFFDGVLRGGTAYQYGTTMQVPEATTYHVESSNNYTENCWLVEAPSYLSVDGVEYNSLTKAYNAITGDTGTVTVIANTVDNSSLPSVPEGKTITFDMNGHEVDYSKSMGNNGNLIIVDNSEGKTGLLKATISNQKDLTIESGYIYGRITSAHSTTTVINGGTIEGTSNAISITGASVYNGTDRKSTLTINDGLILIDNNNNSDLVGISANDFTDIAINGGKIKVNKSGTSDRSATGISGGNITITADNDATVIEATSTDYYGDSAIGITSAKNVILNSGKILVSQRSTGTGRYSTVQGISATTITINNGSIDVSGNNTVSEGLYSYGGTIEINGGDIRVTNEAQSAYGVTVYGYSSARATVTINDGTIYSNATRASSFGIRNLGYEGTENIWINGGKIYGGTYGINNLYNNIVTLGAEGNTVSTTTPEIKGNTSAIYKGTTNYYTGVLKGGTRASEANLITSDGYTINVSNATEDDHNYEIYTLTISSNVAKIGEQEYTSLADAIAAANTGDIIELTANSFETKPMTIPADTTITIQTNGHSLTATKQLVNNGDLTIMDNSEDKTTRLKYITPDQYFIVNNENSTLVLDSLTFTETTKTINNSGTLSITQSNLSASDIAINNISGMLTIASSTINSNNYAIYVSNGNITISDSTIDYIYNDSGEVNINSSTISRSENYAGHALIINNGTMNLTDTQVYQLLSQKYVISNTGTMQLTDSLVAIDNPSEERIHYLYGIDIVSGNLTMTNSTIRITGAGYEKRGIYNENGTFTMESGSIILEGEGPFYGLMNNGTATIKSGEIRVEGKSEAYAIRNSGTLTLGIPESPDSPSYGQDTADVSTTDPKITAINTWGTSYTGIGINSSGSFNYYDGIITGSSGSMNKEPNGIEYLYEPKDEVDENGYHVRTLKWMRAQP